MSKSTAHALNYDLEIVSCWLRRINPKVSSLGPTRWIIRTNHAQVLGQFLNLRDARAWWKSYVLNIFRVDDCLNAVVARYASLDDNARKEKIDKRLDDNEQIAILDEVLGVVRKTTRENIARLKPAHPSATLPRGWSLRLKTLVDEGILKGSIDDVAVKRIKEEVRRREQARDAYASPTEQLTSERSDTLASASQAMLGPKHDVRARPRRRGP